jgi:predicted patatin/cPLA2 family phospholipase
MGVRNFKTDGAYFGLDFAFNTIPNELVPFDYETFRSFSGTLLAGVTDAKTGRMRYLNELTDTNRWEILRATCALPGYCPPMIVNGRECYDGGLCCPIPYAKALHDGCEKIVVILTNTADYVRKLKFSYFAMSQLLKHKYPALEMLFLARYRVYNRQIARICQLEREGKALVFRPEYKLHSFEKDTETMEKVWEMGLSHGRVRIEDVRRFLNA